MQSHAALPYFHISSPYRKWVSFLKFTVYIVKIDKKQNPLKSIAENGSSLPQCIWIVCPTPELVCGGGDKGIETPCTKVSPESDDAFFVIFLGISISYI